MGKDYTYTSSGTNDQVRNLVYDAFDPRLTQATYRRVTTTAPVIIAAVLATTTPTRKSSL